MSLKKTQDYIYFQNKATHYHNIIQAKTKLDTKIPDNLRNTIDYHDIKNAKKHIPHLRQFDIKFDNETMLKRILSKDKSPLKKDNTYARYNSFERSFRHRNPQKNEQKRLIQIQNEKIKKSISKTRAEVGSIQNWRKDYDQNVKHSRLISKFTDSKSKDELIIQTQKFVPDRYLKYLQQAQIENQEQKSQQKHKPKGKLNIEKLFILPHVLSPTSQLNPSQSKSKLSSTTRNNNSSRANLQASLNNQVTVL